MLKSDAKQKENHPTSRNEELQMPFPIHDLLFGIVEAIAGLISRILRFQ